MNRNQGLTVSAIVLAGAILRGGFAGSPGSGGSSQLSAAGASGTVAAGVSPVKGEGPWKASCSYWKPGQGDSSATPHNPAANGKSLSSGKVRASHDGQRLGSRTTAVVSDSDTGCGTDGWGIPSPSAAADAKNAPGESSKANDPQTSTDTQVDLGITTIIATVPDPLHSSLPLEFDRSIEALTQAAAQYGYFGSYFWLPWRRSPTEAGKSSGAADTLPKDDADREKQPGLLILKQDFAMPSAREANRVPSRNGRVIYLFLVGESPALGVNGDQLDNTLRYQNLLAGYKARRTLKDDANEADVIGPSTSGAAASLRAALQSYGDHRKTYEIAGVTSTYIAAQLLNLPGPDDAPILHYRSFGDYSTKERNTLIDNFTSTNHNGQTRLALLTEAGTVFGYAGTVFCNPEEKQRNGSTGCKKNTVLPLVIPFPRDISLLRNASTENAGNADAAAAASVSPYLHLSLKDSSAEDNIQPFARPMYTYSQEAQWMAIARELQDERINVVAVSASSVLDELFLVKSIHRDVPDAQVVLYNGADLLFARIGDNDDYIGDITFTAYPLTDLSSLSKFNEHYSFPDTSSESYYNAAAFTFWDGHPDAGPHLADYGNPFLDNSIRPPLWATVVGRDGYYPLSLVDSVSSDEPRILPEMPAPRAATTGAVTREDIRWSPAAIPDKESAASPTVSPGFTWYLLCLSITLLSIVHGIVLLTANFWSPVTHDLAVKDSDRPRRRSVYVNIAGAILVAMSFIAAFPVYPAWHMLHRSNATALTAAVTFLSGFFSAVATYAKTRSFLRRPCPRSPQVDAESLKARKEAAKDTEGEDGFYPAFNALALATALLVPAAWVFLCLRNNAGGTNAYLGLFFSYRCLFPASGVCPLLPVLLILVTWFIWAHVQTKRLRFSDNRRPMLPGLVGFELPHFFYVSDEALSRCSSPIDSCLYERLNCLLITRQLIRRAFQNPPRYLNHLLGIGYFTIFLGSILFARIHGLDHFFRHGRLPGLYETLICSLFFPLVVIAITGCVRIFAIWAALNRGLLEPLERSPLRFAFTRMRGVSWVSMLRQSGVYEYWRDMTRSMESMQQLLGNKKLSEDLRSLNRAVLSPAEQVQADLDGHLAELWKIVFPSSAEPDKPSARSLRYHRHFLETAKRVCKGIAALGRPAAAPREKAENYLLGDDLPPETKCASLNLMCAMECDFANFAQALIVSVLGPYWLCGREGFVANDPLASETPGDGSARFEDGIPHAIQLAEEYVAIRYIALIRAVLINLRYLTTFVSTAFVLALLAWNSYPFQPRQWVDWTFTFLLFGSLATVFGVYAQMHRSPILSRITGTKANELGSAFFWRLFGFGAIPLLTWLASQFPSISNLVSRLLQSGLSPAK